jgi:hypothetical protein
MAGIHCSLSFKRIKIGDLDGFATGVREGIYVINPTVFPSPPITQVVFDGLIADYQNTWNTYKNARGSATRGAFNVADEALEEALVTMATFVDGKALGSEAIILQGGYTPTRNSNGSRPAPATITGASLQLGATQELLCDCDPQPQIDTYVAILTEGAPLPPDVSIANGMMVLAPGTMTLPRTIYTSYSKSRKKSFTGLTVGTVYYLTMFGIGTGGVSQLCDPVKRMCN